MEYDDDDDGSFNDEIYQKKYPVWVMPDRKCLFSMDVFPLHIITCFLFDDLLHRRGGIHPAYTLVHMQLSSSCCSKKKLKPDTPLIPTHYPMIIYDMYHISLAN